MSDLFSCVGKTVVVEDRFSPYPGNLSFKGRIPPWLKPGDSLSFDFEFIGALRQDFLYSLEVWCVIGSNNTSQRFHENKEHGQGKVIFENISKNDLDAAYFKLEIKGRGSFKFLGINKVVNTTTPIPLVTTNKNSKAPLTTTEEDVNYVLLINYNNGNHKFIGLASSLAVLKQNISNFLEIPTNVQIQIAYHDSEFDTDVIAKNLSEIPKKGKISVSIVSPPSLSSLPTSPLRKENRFGNGLEQIVEKPTEFYPQNYVPKKTITEVIQNEGSLASSFLSSISPGKYNADSSVLSIDEGCLVYMYTVESPFYAHLNKVMRENISNEIDKLRDYIYYLTKTLQKLSKFSGPVFRGIDIQLPAYKVGMEVVWPAFSSASSDPKVALNFMKGGSGTLFLINSKHSFSISKYSAIPKEEECLFQPNSVFKVSGELTTAPKKLLEVQMQVSLENVKIFELEEL